MAYDFYDLGLSLPIFGHISAGDDLALTTLSGVRFSYSSIVGRTEFQTVGPNDMVFQVQGGALSLQMDNSITPLMSHIAATPTNSVAIELKTVVGVASLFFVNSDTPSLNFAIKSITAPGSFYAPGHYDKIVFSTSLLMTIDSISTDLRCFLANTAIATPDGPRAVETLAPGDVITLAEGGTTRVCWLGEQRMNPRFAHPAKVNPICITAGALADGFPERDLMVSADHALGIDGMLINAGALVNGRTIFQLAKMPLDGFTYYHVETDAHELLLAEGCAAESFIDYAGRDSFVNGDERKGAPVIAEMDLPRISDARLVPEVVLEKLRARAESKGVLELA